MSKILFASVLSFCALSVMGVSSAYDKQFAPQGAVDPMITSGLPQALNHSSMHSLMRDTPESVEVDSELYILTGEQNDELCVFERLPIKDGVYAKVRIDTDCSPLHPDLVRAVHWKEHADGLVELIDEAGNSVITFTNTDGTSYETLDPLSIQLAFSPI